MDQNDKNLDKIILTVVTSILGVIGLISSVVWWHASRLALKEPTITQQTTNILSVINFLFISGKIKGN